MNLKILETNYGYKIKGFSKYMFITPHGAGDDINTDILTLKLAEKLKGYAIVNNKFIKYSNSLAKINPESVEDFNRLPFIILTQKYDWQKKKKEMKDFYFDLEEFALEAKEFSLDKRAVIIHIHGMKNDENLGIDIGIGRNFKGKIISQKSKLNLILGKETITIEKAKKLKSILDNSLKKFGLISDIGKNFNAQYKCFGIQYNQVINNNVFQLEICRLLRNNDKIDETVELLSKAFLETFKS